MYNNKSMKKALVTGGAGFIGSHFIRRLLKTAGEIGVLNLDLLTYAGDTARLGGVGQDGRYKFIRGDICNPKTLKQVFSLGIDTVVHFAAESHVDRSIADAAPFIETNVKGASMLLEAARGAGVERFVHISTDEVYGSIREGRFNERSPLAPNSPYAASKAAAEHLVSAFGRTYGVPYIILRPSNNYGPWQHTEKFIPVVIASALSGRPAPIYGEGSNVREWLYVEDCAEAIVQAAMKGKTGEVYNIGSGHEMKNIDVARLILSILGKPETLIEHVADRAGHDFRYAMDCTKIQNELGWKPRVPFEEGIRNTVRWYSENKPWWLETLR